MSVFNRMHLFLTVLLPLAALHLSHTVDAAAAAAAAAGETVSSSRHKRNSVSKVDLDALKDNLAYLEDGLSNFQKRSCAVGINSHHCAIAHLDNVMTAGDFLRGGFSPGKRNTELPEDIQSQAELLLQNLSEQKEAVSSLRRLLGQLGLRPNQEKRTCKFRLGNHCLTEALDRAANQYYYLQSALSPGRRRREAVATGGQQSASSSQGEAFRADRR